MFASSIWHLAVISVVCNFGIYFLVYFVYVFLCVCCYIIAPYCYFCSGFCVILLCLSFLFFFLISSLPT